MKNNLEILFTIETNTNFNKLKLNSKDSNLVKEIYNKFKFVKKIKKIKLINKKSLSSKIFQITDDEKKEKMLRSSKRSDLNKLNFAIKKIKNLENYNFFFKLIKTTKNKYIYIFKKNIYILYHKVPGNIYSGKIFDFYKILEKVILVHKNFNLKDKFYIKKINNNFKNFEDFILKDNFQTNSNIKKKTREILSKNKKFILNQIKHAKSIKLFNDMQTVHDDLNHANVIIDKSKIIFLDLEDIKMGSLNLALSFFIFKFMRHSIYKKKNYT